MIGVTCVLHQNEIKLLFSVVFGLEEEKSETASKCEREQNIKGE